VTLYGIKVDMLWGCLVYCCHCHHCGVIMVSAEGGRVQWGAIVQMLACNALRSMNCGGRARDKGGGGVALVGAISGIDNVCLVIIGSRLIRF